MTKLGVNIDHIATLRQQRHTFYPSPLIAAKLAEEAGADLITLHLREDRRHIQDADVYAIHQALITHMNLECSLTKEMLNIACTVRPKEVCLVPEQRSELTTEGGLEITRNFFKISDAVNFLTKAGIQVSLFINPDIEQITAAAKTGVSTIELHTGIYSETSSPKQIQIEIQRIKIAIEISLKLGLQVNLGHGLNYDNIAPIAGLYGISVFNIGHSIVSQAIFDGWNKAVRDMKAIIVQKNQQALYRNYEL